MPSLKDTKRRIVSVKNTQKITRAMKLVSSAKYARANTAVLNARPYSNSFEKLVSRLSKDSEVSSPLIEQRDENKILLIAVMPDRGLCGSLNANLLKSCKNFIREKISKKIKVDLVLWGKRSFSLKKDFHLSSVEIVEKKEKVLEKISFDVIHKESSEFNKLFRNKQYDRVYCCYSKFRSALVQEPRVDLLLPIEPVPDKKSANMGYLLEPQREILVNKLLNRKVAIQLYSILLESSAAEHAARMTAMDNATNNADEVIRKLTLEYNRARQAAITKELIEITSGAEAL